jgi:hypothetical protein
VVSVVTVQERVARLRAEICALTATPLDVVDGVSGPALHEELRRASDQLQAFTARVLARVQADGRWAAGTSRTFEDWMATKQLASTGAVRRDVALGHALDHDLPATARELAAGGVTLAHAQVLARVGPSTPARRAALAGDDAQLNETALLARARTMPVNHFRREVDRWAARVDAASAEREHELASVKEHLTVTRRPDGFAFTGFLTHEHGLVLATSLRAVAGVPCLGDERSTDQRQAAALVDACRLVLDRGLAGGGQQVRPHIDVHVSWETMQRLAAEHPATDGPDDGQPDADGAEVSGPVVGGPVVGGPVVGGPVVGGPVAPAELRDGEPIPASLLARIACDSQISRIVFGPRGEVLDVGRAQRTYSGALRRAVIARDRTCRFPGCTAPVGLGEVHHVVPWARGGLTSVRTGILLCYYHHDLVHRRRLVITNDGGAQWSFTHPDGRPIPPPGAIPPTAATSSTRTDAPPLDQGGTLFDDHMALVGSARS